MKISLNHFSFVPFLFFITFFLSVPLVKAMEVDSNPLTEDDRSFLSVKANVLHQPQKALAFSEEERPAVLCSLDGGGIRGLFSAKLLELIDQAVQQKTQAPLANLVDMYAGTSTGGLIALALATGKSPSDCVQLYQKKGPDIFSSTYYQSVTSIWGWWGARYDPTNLNQVLNSAVGDTSLKDAQKEVFVTTFVPDQNRILLLHKGINISMKEAAQATTAAPTYFPPVLLNIEKKPKATSAPGTIMKLDEKFLCVDGGVGPNNPSRLGVSMLHKRFPGRPPFVISIGTGEPPLQTRRGGVLGFISQAVNTFSNANSAATEKDLKMDLPKGNYFRFEFLTDIALDDTSSQSLSILAEKAEDIAKTEKFNELIDRLVELSKRESSLQ